MNSTTVHNPPSPSVINEIIDFTRQEVGWTTGVLDFDLTCLHDAIFLTIRDPFGKLLGTGSLNNQDDTSFWIDYIIVARSHRRRGIGTQIASTLVNFYHEKRKSARTTLSLLASNDGAPLYLKLGFSQVPCVRLGLLARRIRDSLPQIQAEQSPCSFPCNDKDGIYVQKVTDTTGHAEALKFFHTIHQYDRTRLLQHIFSTSGLCAVVKDACMDHHVVGAAWGRWYHMLNGVIQHDGDDARGVFIGPVVANCDRFAVKACSEVLRMAAQSDNEGGYCNDSTITMLTINHCDRNLAQVFKSSHFRPGANLRYMMYDERICEADCQDHEDDDEEEDGRDGDEDEDEDGNQDDDGGDEDEDGYEGDGTEFEGVDEGDDDDDGDEDKGENNWERQEDKDKDKSDNDNDDSSSGDGDGYDDGDDHGRGVDIDEECQKNEKLNHEGECYDSIGEDENEYDDDGYCEQSEGDTTYYWRPGEPICDNSTSDQDSLYQEDRDEIQLGLTIDDRYYAVIGFDLG